MFRNIKRYKVEIMDLQTIAIILFMIVLFELVILLAMDIYLRISNWWDSIKWFTRRID